MSNQVSLLLAFNLVFVDYQHYKPLKQRHERHHECIANQEATLSDTIQLHPSLKFSMDQGT